MKPWEKYSSGRPWEKYSGGPSPASADSADKTWDDASLLSKITDFNWLTHERLKKDPSREPIEPSIGKNLAYAGNLVATGAIQGAKELASGTGNMKDVRAALAGDGKSAPQQLEEAGLPPAAAYGLGIPLQVVTDPMAGFTAPALAKALQPVADKATNVGRAIADRLRRTGVSAAVRHLRPTPAVARSLGKEGLQDVGEEALRSGAIRPFQKVESTAGRLEDLADEVGRLKGDLVENSGAMVDPQVLAGNVQKNVITPLERTTIGKGPAQAIRERVTNLVKDVGDGPVPAARIEAEKMAEQGSINWLTEPKLNSGAVRGYSSELRQAVEDAMGGDPAFLAAKKSYGNIAEGLGMASRTAGLTDGGTGLMGHIADTATAMEGIKGLATGNPVQALTPVARAISKGRVASTVATGAYGAGGLVQKAAERLTPVAQAIAARTGAAVRFPQSRPRGDQPENTPQAPRSPESLRQDLVDQQTDPAAQEELKRSQE